MSKYFEQTSFLFGSNSIFIEELYQKYTQDPDSVDASWRDFFLEFTDTTPIKTTAKVILKEPLVPEKSGVVPATSLSENSLRAKFMIMAYRNQGHYLANLDPLGLEKLRSKADLGLTIENFGFNAKHLNEMIDVTGDFGDITTCALKDLIDILDQTYSESVAAEFSHVENKIERKWLYDRLEDANLHSPLSMDDKKDILADLCQVEGFEQYLHTKFPGAKRFSIEGGDASIICLDKVIEFSVQSGAREAVIGLAHRGRLSTLTKVMKKPYRAVLSEFMGNSAFPSDLDVAGDVKYHMGYSSDRVINGADIHLSLTPNPSHLEAVNPVVAGKVRAKQDLNSRNRNSVIGILVHGDAAFCGQGVVAESLVMSGLNPYDVGGIFHLVINNQIGFTANSYDARSGRYCTEFAKSVGAPVIHVNGDDIESVILVTKIASDYRVKFGKDIVVDIVCYRKYGHNEGDEPMYTQSMMYNVIKDKPTPAAVYAKKLVAEGVIAADYYEKLKADFKTHLDLEFEEAEGYKPRAQWLEGQWQGFEGLNDKSVMSGVKKSYLQKLGSRLCDIPKEFAINKKLTKLFAARVKSLTNDDPIDWATGEQLAFGTILSENISIRMTGQDVERGTFSHRHSVLHSQVNNDTYEPLNNISEKQPLFEIADSNLSEYGVLGFEYGYSQVNPKNLVIWEAQFGDFSNGAQIIFDQFIFSAETKWLRMSGLVVLLPNGMEGQGPEHSSARLERFLQMAAEDNVQIAYPTTPASIFHLLRRQVLRSFRKPLIIMSPKSLLRHKLAVSNLSELDEGTSFLSVIDEIDSEIKPNKAEKVIFCTGKVYYDLLEARRENKINNIAIIRIEELYPFNEELVIKIIAKYIKAKKFVWCQEEPKNFGAWSYIREYMELSLNKAGVKSGITYVGREKAASPAVGYLYVHNRQQELLVKEALEIK